MESGLVELLSSWVGLLKSSSLGLLNSWWENLKLSTAILDSF